MGSVLIFPIDMYQSRDFYKTVKMLELPAVLASSEMKTVSDGGGSVVHLPYVTDGSFEEKFLELIDIRKISMIFVPHLAIWWWVKDLVKRQSLSVKICNENPFDLACSSYRSAYAWAQSCLEPLSLHSSFESRPFLSSLRYANLHRGYSNIPGQSDDEKIRLLTYVAQHAPNGDLIEIGSAYGRSAYALAFLAKNHKMGNLICVDPWKLENIQNQGEESKLLNEAIGSGDMNEVFLNFIVSLSSFDNVNYIRMPSSEAVFAYKEQSVHGFIETPQFGRTEIDGSISVLHVDGNHAYEEVSADMRNWIPLIKKGGWVLLDDYLWAFGNGPQRAGDEFLSSFDWTSAFCVGDTLCVQM